MSAKSTSMSVRSCVRLVLKGIQKSNGVKIPFFLSEAVGIHEAGWLTTVLGEGLNRLAPGVELNTKSDLVNLLMTDWGGRAQLEVDEADAYADTLLAKAMEVQMAKEAARKQLKLARTQKQVENREQYRHTNVFRFYNKCSVDDQAWSGGFRWHFDREVRGVGLMDHICGLTELTTQPMLVDLHAPEGEEWVAAKAWDNALTRIHGAGYACSKQKLLWNRSSEGWRRALGLFPNAVDFNAYNHGLNAPVVPGGYMPDCKVTIRSIKDDAGVILDSDGSGRIHPLHPLFTQMGRPTPHYPVQIRWFNSANSFAKGILVPDDRCVDAQGKPAIWLDWKQIKGCNKAAAKTARERDRVVESSGWMGVIQVWDVASKIDWSFEQLENIQTNDRTREIVSGMVVKAMQQMEKGGVMGLAQRVAKDSKVAMMVLKIIASMNAQGLNVNPLQFPLMKSQILDRLGKQLWWVSQGAGVSMDRFVAVQDQSVAAGSCVIRGYKPGQQIACMRYPVVLSQGLATLTVQEPLRHHQVAGEIVPFTIYMHPADLTGCLMGDDDGDTIGVSGDPDILELWSQIIDSQRYAIEPKGELVQLNPESPEGLKYLSQDHRDDVGKLTIMRTKLLAVGDLRGAVAISCLIQEAIDRAKRVVVWTDWRLAVDINTWEETSGTLKYCGPKLTGALPIEEIAKWTNQRVYHYGGLQKGVKASAIAWRSQFSKDGSGRAAKRVNPQTWQTCAEAGKWVGGNLVHHSNDTALACWKQMESRFLPDPTASGDISGLLRQALDLLELEVDGEVAGIQYYPEMTWQDYTGYRRQWGLDSFRQSMQTCMGKADEAGKLMAIDQLIEERAEEMLQMQSAVGEFEMVRRMELMWRMEASNDRSEGLGEGNLNSALYSICWAESPILTWLGIESGKDTCSYLNSGMIGSVVKKCLATEEPITTLMGIIRDSTGHEKAILDEDGEGVPAYCCQDCIDRLSLQLIRTIRKAKDSGQAKRAIALRTELQG